MLNKDLMTELESPKKKATIPAYSELETPETRIKSVENILAER